jgi:hypothetical protein
VHAAQVGLLNDPDVQLHGDDQRDHAHDRQDVRGQQHQTDGRGDHRREHRVADQRERPGRDEAGDLVMVHADAPRPAHSLLREHRGHDSHAREHGTEDPHDPPVQHGERPDYARQLRRWGDQPHHDGDDEQGSGPPLRRAHAPADPHEPGGSGAPTMQHRAHAEGHYQEPDVRAERDPAHHPIHLRTDSSG